MMLTRDEYLAVRNELNELFTREEMQSLADTAPTLAKLFRERLHDEDAVERAAKALNDHRFVEGNSMGGWDEISLEARDLYRKRARAALASAGDLHLTFDEAEAIAKDDFNNGYELGRKHQADAAPGPSLQIEIWRWANRTFGNPDQAHRMTKLGNEVAELRRVTTERIPTQDVVADECADIMHLMFQIAEAWDFDLLDETRKKFEINKRRSWEPQPDGTYQHVETSNE